MNWQEKYKKKLITRMKQPDWSNPAIGWNMGLASTVPGILTKHWPAGG
jgi:hypothetical protein